MSTIKIYSNYWYKPFIYSLVINLAFFLIIPFLTYVKILKPRKVFIIDFHKIEHVRMQKKIIRKKTVKPKTAQKKETVNINKDAKSNINEQNTISELKDLDNSLETIYMQKPIYPESLRQKETIEEIYRKLKIILERGKIVLYPEELKKVEKIEKLYLQKKMGLMDYLKYLINKKELKKENLKKYINISILIKSPERAHDKIDLVKLYEEIEDLTYEVKEKYSIKGSDIEKLLYCERYLKLLKGYTNNQVNIMGKEKWEAHKKDFSKIAEELIEKLSYKNIFKQEKEKLKIQLKTMENFYTFALKRNEILVKNMLSSLARRHNDCSLQAGVMVIGGFHTQGITEILRNKGISYKVIQPRIINKIDRTIYLKKLNDQAFYIFPDNDFEFKKQKKEKLTSNFTTLELISSFSRPQIINILMEANDMLNKNRTDIENFFVSEKDHQKIVVQWNFKDGFILKQVFEKNRNKRFIKTEEFIIPNKTYKLGTASVRSKMEAIISYCKTMNIELPEYAYHYSQKNLLKLLESNLFRKKIKTLS